MRVLPALRVMAISVRLKCAPVGAKTCCQPASPPLVGRVACARRRRRGTTRRPSCGLAGSSSMSVTPPSSSWPGLRSSGSEKACVKLRRRRGTRRRRAAGAPGGGTAPPLTLDWPWRPSAVPIQIVSGSVGIDADRADRAVVGDREGAGDERPVVAAVGALVEAEAGLVDGVRLAGAGVERVAGGVVGIDDQRADRVRRQPVLERRPARRSRPCASSVRQMPPPAAATHSRQPWPGLPQFGSIASAVTRPDVIESFRLSVVGAGRERRSSGRGSVQSAPTPARAAASRACPCGTARPSAASAAPRRARGLLHRRGRDVLARIGAVVERLLDRRDVPGLGVLSGSLTSKRSPPRASRRCSVSGREPRPALALPPVNTTAATAARTRTPVAPSASLPHETPPRNDPLAAHPTPGASSDQTAASPSRRSTSTQSFHSPSSRPCRRWMPDLGEARRAVDGAARGVVGEHARGELVEPAASRGGGQRVEQRDAEAAAAGGARDVDAVLADAGVDAAVGVRARRGRSRRPRRRRRRGTAGRRRATPRPRARRAGASRTSPRGPRCPRCRWRRRPARRRRSRGGSARTDGIDGN